MTSGGRTRNFAVEEPTWTSLRTCFIAVMRSPPTRAGPTGVIISDGAYGIRGFHGDTTGVGELANWYRPHVAAWSRHARPPPVVLEH